jgi:formate/nitrite transporter FocA (FNT family)
MSGPTGESKGLTSPKGSREDPELEETYDRLLSEGKERVTRPLLPLLATGLLGGVDVGVGVLSYLVVEAQTGDKLLASLAFTIGFVALLLAHSELFTENFLVPVIAVVAKEARLLELLRLWGLTLVTNLIAGFAMAGMIVVALPSVHEVAMTGGSHFAHLGFTWRAFFLAVLAGAVITMLTRMQHATEQLVPQIIAAVAMSFVLVAAQLFHSVLDSILMFAGLLAGATDYTYLDWVQALVLACVGNLIGGLVLVTSIRLLRIPHRVAESRAEGGPGDSE